MTLDPLGTAALAVAAAIGGWLAGIPSAWITLWLASEPRKRLSSTEWLALDPLVQAGLAVAWAALLVRLGPSLRWAAAALLAVPLVQIAITDFRTRYMYPPLAIAGTIVGVALSGTLFGASWLDALLGALGGLALFLVLYWVGRLAYRGREEPLAAGDIYIAAMVGAMSGSAMRALYTLILGIILGGVLALVYWAALRSRKALMPYGPGLCLAGLLTLFNF